MVFYHVGSEGRYKSFEPGLANLGIVVHGQMEKKKSPKKPKTQPLFLKAAMCLELPIKSVHLFFSFKLTHLKCESVIGFKHSQRNKIPHPNCLYIMFDLGEFDIFRMVPSSV